MTDIQAKYQKLAAEFAKVRSQVPVLKKAVLDEQAKEEELKDLLKTKDQSIRKYEQEVDSLSFRNQQLYTRVEVLQRDLDDSNFKSKKNKKNAVAPPSIPSNVPNNSVIGEELQNKITENAKLHTQLYENEHQHKEEITKLKDDLEKLGKEAGRHQSVLDESVHRYMNQVDKLQEDKIHLEVKLQKKENLRKDTEEKAISLEEQLRNVEVDLSSQLKTAKDVIRQKLPFYDCGSSELNSLNIPLYDRQHQLHCKELLGQMSVLVHDIVQGLSNWYTYTEQRVQFYPIDSHKEPISHVSKKYCEYLHENAALLKPVNLSYKQFISCVHEDSITTLETATGLQGFSTCLSKATAYVSKLLPYQLLSLDEENTMSICTSGLEARNKELQTSCTCLDATLTKINSYVSALASHSSCKESLPYSSQPTLFSLLCTSVTDINKVFEDLAKHYRAKMSLEHELPTFTEKLKVTNDCIMSALLSLVNVTGKMTKFFNSHKEFICKQRNTLQADNVPRFIHPNTTGYRKKAANYIASLARPCTDSVPHSTAVHNRKTLYSSTESRDSLAQQVVTLQEKVNTTEQNREHWMLETKLLQMKYEKECQKNRELQKRLAGPEKSTPGVSIIDPPTTPPVSETIEKLGVVLRRTVSEDQDIEAREKLIKQYYTEKISQLTQQMQYADSKALHFHAECRALFKRLSIVQCDKDKLQKEMDASNQSISQLNDELQTTKRSYEGQLSMMSEHLATMNEKLTTQKDEIDMLKYQLQNNPKPSKRGFLSK